MRVETGAGLSACRNARNGHARARRRHHCPPMSGVRLDASTAPVADRYWIDTKESPCRLSTVTAQGNTLQSVVVVLPLGSVITTRIFVAPGFWLVVWPGDQPRGQSYFLRERRIPNPTLRAARAGVPGRRLLPAEDSVCGVCVPDGETRLAGLSGLRLSADVGNTLPA